MWLSGPHIFLFSTAWQVTSPGTKSGLAAGCVGKPNGTEWAEMDRRSQVEPNLIGDADSVTLCA